MYYCSIEDAWGNNFNNKYSVYKQNNIKETQPQLKDTLPNDEKILLKDTKTDNSDLMRNKKISLEKEIEETIEKIYEMKNKKKKTFRKNTKNERWK